MLRTVFGLMLLGAVGCYHKDHISNDLVVFTYKPWVMPLTIAVGIAFIPVGIVVARKRKSRWWALVSVGGLAIAGVVAPTYSTSRFSLTLEGFISVRGYWWNINSQQVRFDELRTVTILVEEDSGRFKSHDFYFDCLFKNGHQERISLGNLMKEALPELIGVFHYHGIKVIFPANFPLF